MNSITNVVTVKYGHNDEPEPWFLCPVVVDPKILLVVGQTTLEVETVISAAASAVELVSRFEEATQYVDFATRLNSGLGERPLGMRIKLVQGQLGDVARIDCLATDRHRTLNRVLQERRPVLARLLSPSSTGTNA